MSSCNYCLLKSIKRRAARSNFKVTVLCDAHWGMGGQNVYVHPKHIRITALDGGEDGERAYYREAWMAEIPGRCEC